MNRMEPFLPYLALAFLALGTIISGVLTVRYRDDATNSRDKIVEMNRAIDSSVNRVEKLNIKIKKSTENTEKLAVEIDEVTNQIKDAQLKIKFITTETRNLAKSNNDLNKMSMKMTDNLMTVQNELKQISEKNSEITNNNLKISEESKKIVNQLADFQTGGDSYLKGNLIYDDQNNNAFLVFTVKGNNSMRNINISILDNMIKKEKRKKFLVPTILEKNVINNNWMSLNIQKESMTLYERLLFKLDANNYENDLDFTVIVHSENFRTQQSLMFYDFKADTKDRKFYSKIVYQGKDSELRGKTLSKRINNFPMNEYNQPIRKERDK